MSHKDDQINENGGTKAVIKGRKHKPLQALKAAALKTSTGDDDTSVDVQKQTNITIEHLPENVDELIKDGSGADSALNTILPASPAKQRSFSPLLSKIMFREKSNLTFDKWVEQKMKQKGVQQETGFFTQMCLSSDEKAAGLHFEKDDLIKRKAERESLKQHYKSRIRDLKESYKVAKRKRRSKIKIALGMIKEEQKQRMEEIRKRKPDKKPWLTQQHSTKMSSKRILESRGSNRSNRSNNDASDGSVHDVVGGILEVNNIPLAKVPDSRWQRLSKPVRPLVKKPESEETIAEDKGKKKIEFMALTEDERLSLIELLPKKFFTNKQYQSELKKARPQKKSRINGKGENIGKWKKSNVGRRVMDYSGVFPVLSKNRKEPIKVDPYTYYLEEQKPRNDKMLIKNNFPGPKDGVEAKAWDIYGQSYFSGNKFEKRLMRLRARLQHDREARKINLKWIDDSLNNLKLYRADLGYDECERAKNSLDEVVKYLDIQSYGLKSMIDEDVKENLDEILIILKKGLGEAGEVNGTINGLMSFLTVEFGNGQRSLEKRYPKIQDHVNTTLQDFLDTKFTKCKSLYDDAKKYHEAGKVYRLQSNVDLARDEIQARARLAEIDAWKEEMGNVYREMRSIPHVDTTRKKKAPPQKCWVCKSALSFESKSSEFTFCASCNNFNENKRIRKKIYATTDKRKQQAIKNLHVGVDAACKKIGTAVLNGEIVNVDTFANIRRLERLSEIPTSPLSPGPGWYDNLDVRNLANPYGGNGPRKISLAKPGTLEKHLDEIKFQERLKSYGWSNKLKNKIKQIRQEEQDGIANLENATLYDEGAN